LSVVGAEMMASTSSSADADTRRADAGRGGGGGGGGRTAASRRRGAPAASETTDVATRQPVAVSGPPAPAAAAARFPRPKRIRTTFKYHELQLMKTYFELNHNPDNNDLKQLSLKTGLSKRVLQASGGKFRTPMGRVEQQAFRRFS